MSWRNQLAVSTPLLLLVVRLFVGVVTRCSAAPPDPNAITIDDYYYAELVGNKAGRGLFPNIFNLATNAIITANATCGETAAENYCKLVEHVFMRSPQCDVCDASNPYKRHPIEFATDGTNRYWQSPTIANGPQYEWVTITFDLRQQYQVAYVIIKAAIAPRPARWILERSMDGLTWKPWQYYATTDEECMRVFGIPGAPQVPKFTSDDEVICTSHYSALDPLEDGEIHTSLVNGRSGLDGPSEALQEFTKARFVRLRLQKIRTLNSDLIYITRRPKHEHIDESVTRRYFYAIRDISIGGQCICYGHAQSCPADPVTGQLRCECMHNTCGESCEMCCPLFNQKVWRPGTIAASADCEPCQCFNHATSCLYDPEVEKQGLSLTPNGIYEGGGVCIDCQHNTQGINCQDCKPFFYRPTGVSHYNPDACRHCDCDIAGSIDGTCVKDHGEATNGMSPGDCHCKAGFGGRRCDRCALGYRNYPICEPCPCSIAGSINYATCKKSCQCKKNVVGVFCDRCKPGFFNLDIHNPDGCTPCFCFGTTSECEQINWKSVKITNMTGWTLTDADGMKSNGLLKNSVGMSLTANSRQVQDKSFTHWKAPPAYLGDRILSYGGLLQYFVYFVADAHGPLMPMVDVIIKGNRMTIEHSLNMNFPERENISVYVRLDEHSDWFHRDTQLRVNKREFMTVLANVQVLMIRAVYHKHQIQSSIHSISLETASPHGTGHVMKSVEKCSCPPHLTGSSCQSCELGYRRVDDELFKGMCKVCACNGHSNTCDPFTGRCIDCMHSTTGSSCEHCLRGFYGNPLLPGEAMPCKPCACPLLLDSNNFSPTCTLSEYTVATVNVPGDYVCTECANGYTGNKCEQCADGFYGQPMKPGNFCTPCQCNGNIDLDAIGNCDHVTGRCLKCIGNTDGWSCEKCKVGFYGNALSQDCKDCSCSARGSVSLQCSATTGQCTCREHYVGRQCDRCEDGFGDVTSGCPLCQCSDIGAYSKICDPVSGQCQCKPGVFGKNCEYCLTGYFGFSSEGCQFCNCFSASNVKLACDNITGQCLCPPHVAGQRCDRCERGYYNISSADGCLPCSCDEEGAFGVECDQDSGQCDCKPGVTGQRCDKCAANYFGLTINGCKECPLCPAAGHVCDPNTGECVCPPNTVGDMCERCASDSWSYDPLKGCERCHCNANGSVGTSCDPVTGQCKCRTGYNGRICSDCHHGHYGFPQCRKCDCHSPGVRPESCTEKGSCSCDNLGQCQCKKNVHTLKCTECQPYSFSLEADNPNGCTECFCFTRTNFCIQSSYVWQQVSSPDRIAFFGASYSQWKTINAVRVLPSEPLTVNVQPTMDHVPLYWSLGEEFLGDKVTTYNGYLRFRVGTKGDNYLSHALKPDEDLFEKYPLVVIVGNYRVVLEHYKTRQAIDPLAQYRVRLREDQWKARNQKEVHVSRQLFMVALQNVQAVYVRATFDGDHDNVKEAFINGLTMDIAVWDNATSAVNNTAVGVEVCDCPNQYAGTSCQKPADGFCQKRVSNYLDSENDLDLVGWAEPCFCNGHANSCDRDTCRCLNCLHNTTGDICERCADGFYGDATQGTDKDCHPCACPTVGNSFSSTCRTVLYGRGYMCDSCLPGYAGEYCQICQEGYYGNPVDSRGSCQPCNCNVNGSMDDKCDILTGQCKCRPGIRGRDCSECAFRHALVGSTCEPCDVDCVGELFRSSDELTVLRRTLNFTSYVPAPWNRLGRAENATVLMRTLVDHLVTGDALTDDIDRVAKSVKALPNTADSLRKDAKYLEEKMQTFNETMTGLNANIQSWTEEVAAIDNKAKSLYSVFVAYLSDQKPTMPGNITTWLAEVTDLLATMKARDEILQKYLHRAEMELKRQETQLGVVFAKKLNKTQFALLTAKFHDLLKHLEYYRQVTWETVRKQTTSAEGIGVITKKIFQQYLKMLDESKELESGAATLLTSADELLDKSQQHLLNVHDDYREVSESLLPQHQKALMYCEATANHLSSLLPKYKEMYLIPAQAHASDLEVQAAVIKDSFTETKDASQLALTASAAYENIVEGLHNASIAANKARTAAIRTDQLTADPNYPLEVRAKHAVNDSTHLLNAVRDLPIDWLKEELRKNANLRASVEGMSSGLAKDIDILPSRFDKFDDFHNRIEGVYEHAEKAVDQPQLKGIADSVNGLSMKLKAIRSFTGLGIRNITDFMQKSLEKVKSARNTLDEVRSQASSNDQRVIDLNKQLLLLKEKIEEAREKASKVKLSVKSDEAGCFRSYLSPAAPTVSNDLHIAYRPLDSVPDSLLFITQTEKTRTQMSEYLAVELRDRQIVFLWNIGDGDQKITNPMLIRSIALNDKNSWYLIDVKRQENSTTLTVTSPENTTTVQYNSVHAMSAVFNTFPGRTTLSVGVDAGRKPSAVKTSEFRGVIGQIIFDRQQVPLWNFVSSERCTASFPKTPPPREDDGQKRGFLFRDGYAQVKSNGHRYDMLKFRIQVNFATYSESGLIYFRGDPHQKDFMSIELYNGHVVLQFFLGGVSKLRLQSNEAYNDGKFHDVLANRSNFSGSLRVDGEGDKVNGEATPDNRTALNIRDFDHFIGGVPDTFEKDSWVTYNIQWKGFYGCIRSVALTYAQEVEIAKAVKSLNVEEGCVESSGQLNTADRVVSFNGNGMLTMQGFALGVNSSLAFNFRTHSMNAVLFYESVPFTSSNNRRRRRRQAEEKGFVTAFLSKGRIVVQLGIDAESKVSLETDNKYNDGRLHTVFIKRQQLGVSLFVDDHLVYNEVFRPNDTIGSVDAVLFLGGVSTADVPVEELPVTVPLNGCLSDFFVNFRFMPLIPEHLQNARLGHCANVYSDGPFGIPATDPLLADSSGSVSSFHLFSKRMKSIPVLEHPSILQQNSSFDDDAEEGFLRKASFKHVSKHWLLPTPFQTLAVPTTVATTTASVPQSHCKPPTYAKSIDDAVFYSSDDSFTRIPLETSSFGIKSIRVSLEFRTVEASGTLLAWANKKFTHFVLTLLIDGRLFVKVRGHKMNATTMVDADRDFAVNDGQWHSLSVIKQGRQMSLQLDHSPAKYLKNLPRSLTLKGGGALLVGGVPRRFAAQSESSLASFVGCIKSFVFNGETKDLAVKGRNVLPCRAKLVPGIYVRNAGYMRFDYVFGTGLASVELGFRSEQAVNGLLVAFFDPSQRVTFFTLQLRNAVLYATLLSSGPTVGYVELSSPAAVDLCDDRWHHVLFTIRSEASLMIDGVPADRRPFDGTLWNHKDCTVFVAGLPAESAATVPKTLGNFSGCIRELRVNGNVIHWDDASVNAGVLRDACPLS